ncbi:hypothetical protein P8625_04235 [Tenacibaculum tangerinum]|uniref:Anti-sigma factor n=1 Tax=Tenacibaculum tangerinum TaxID=3038772 RepID=A0ABY8L4R1_9FLAO|nr:hypothetical protein [Tenacibaculum tangerinum]WGH76375.1 hypothetical protein P8625_04235 [Tenacibaculum tangerinum]
MEDKLHQFFKENDFDVFEPNQGHLNRFQRKLENPKQPKKPSYFWMSIAASIVLILGFYLGSYQQKNTYYDLADVSPKMAEAQNFFVTTINQELKEVEQYRNIDTEIIIEDSLNEIEELEDQYKTLTKELIKRENRYQIIREMIQNYQQRLTILEKLLLRLELQQNPAKLELLEDEII